MTAGKMSEHAVVTRRDRVLRSTPPDDWSPRVFLINGPPRAGKDTLATLLRMAYGSLALERFSHPLKVAIPSAFGLDARVIELTDEKDRPRAELYGRSYRDLQISLSEDWFKPQFGPGIFGILCARRIHRYWKRCYRGVVIPDCGFAPEAVSFIEHMPGARVVLIRVHRHGCAWDSREPVHLQYVRSMDIHNTSTPHNMLASVRGHMREMFGDEADL